GLARVDFFVDRQGGVLVNGINTMPGFTKISMYPKLWERSGLSYPALLDRLIEIALEKYRERQALRTSLFEAGDDRAPCSSRTYGSTTAMNLFSGKLPQP